MYTYLLKETKFQVTETMQWLTHYFLQGAQEED